MAEMSLIANPQWALPRYFVKKLLLGFFFFFSDKITGWIESTTLAGDRSNHEPIGIKLDPKKKKNRKKNT